MHRLVNDHSCLENVVHSLGSWGPVPCRQFKVFDSFSGEVVKWFSPTVRQVELGFENIVYCAYDI